MGKRTEQSKKTYDKMALEYDSSPEGHYTTAHKAELIKKVIVKDNDTILDVACGNGFLLAELAKKAKVNAFGIDLSENMIAMAKRRYPHCAFTAQPCFPLPFNDASVDVITVSCAFHHFENPQGFVVECMRVLRKNGMLYMAEPYFPPIIRWIANGVVFPFSKSGDVKVYSAKELHGLFEKARFTDIQTHIKNTVLFFEAKKQIKQR